MRYREKAVLVVLDLGKDYDWTKEEKMQELKALALSSQAKGVAEIISKRSKPDAAYFIGKGKTEEVAVVVAENKADLVIFNDDLSNAQIKNLERSINIKVIDRTQLILDVFAQRAKSTEGKIQVELAQLQYLLPRLSGRGQMLSRLGAGIGTRGPGEQKLEVDRRRIQKRISKLKKDLNNIEKRRLTLREKRRRNVIPTVALVGYTNSGKSTLLNSLTGASQIVQDKFFSTLDPKLRKLILPNNQTVLIADTVGFLHDLPHHLIESFKATLEEVIEADILLHVLDISNPKAKELQKSVYEVLGELNVRNKPIITVLNKIDKVPEKSLIDNFQKKVDSCVSISAQYKVNLGELVKLISMRLANLRTFIKVLIPYDKMNLINAIHSQGEIITKEYKPEGVYIEAEVPLLLAKKHLTNS